MAIKAYVLMSLVTADPIKAMKALREIEEVQSADAVIGPFDAIAIVEAADMDMIGKMVVEKILQVEGVSKTLTCVKF